MQMKGKPARRFWIGAAQFILGLAGLALATLVCFRLALGLAPTGFVYLVLVVLLSLMGSVGTSILLSIIAVALLNFFFTQPLFEVRVDAPEDIVALIAFVTTSLLVSTLVAKVRRSEAAAEAEQKALVDTIPALVWVALPGGSGDFRRQRFDEFKTLSTTGVAGSGWLAAFNPEEPVREAFHPEDREKVISTWRSAVAKGELFEVEARMRSAADEYRAVLIRAAPLRDERGTILKWYGVSTDIEEHRRATEAVRASEEALRESEEQWRAVFENNPTMYFMVDAAGTILSVNPFGAEQLGYTADELTGQSVLNVFHAADREAVQRNAAKCLERLGQTMTWELRKCRKDGSMLWVRETAKAMMMKGRPVVLIVCEDITERRNAEYLTGQVFECSPDEVLVLGRGYTYQRVNPVFERNWDMPAERIVGKHVAEIRGMETFERILKPNLDRCFDGEEVRYAAWFEYPRDRRYLAVTYTPLRPKSDVVEGALVITRDLTEYMLASEALNSAQAELAHVNRLTTMGQLTASIAHEVNQPITAVVTHAHAARRWLEVEPPDLNETRVALAHIVKDSNRASDVINRIRALIKKIPPGNDLLDINEIIVETIALSRSELNTNRIAMQTHFATDLPPVHGDRVQLQQVVLNLIINGIEAMNELSGRRALAIDTSRDGSGGTLVTVSDSGSGLGSETLPRLFEAFYTTKPGGIGMGLSICRSIIEAHGGRLWADANSPRGAIFRFTLPAPANPDC